MLNQENVKIVVVEVERLTQGPQHKPGHKENENYEPVKTNFLRSVNPHTKVPVKHEEVSLSAEGSVVTSLDHLVMLPQSYIANQCGDKVNPKHLLRIKYLAC